MGAWAKLGGRPGPNGALGAMLGRPPATREGFPTAAVLKHRRLNIGARTAQGSAEAALTHDPVVVGVVVPLVLGSTPLR